MLELLPFTPASRLFESNQNDIAPSAMGLFDVVAEELAGKDLPSGQASIIKIIVASGSEKPYFKKKYGMTEKGCFIRVGTAAEPMPQQMIDKFSFFRKLLAHGVSGH